MDTLLSFDDGILTTREQLDARRAANARRSRLLLAQGKRTLAAQRKQRAVTEAFYSERKAAA